MRVLFGWPLRQTQGFIQSLLALMGLALAVPDYSTLSRRQGALAVVLPKKQPDSPDSPMHLVVDSTGLKVYGRASGRCVNTAGANGGHGANCMWGSTRLPARWWRKR